MAKDKPLPRTLGACADEIGAIDARLTEIAAAIRALALSKECDALVTRRKRLEEKLIEELPASDANGICGKTTRATIKTKRVPTIKDWDALTKHIKKTGDFDLIQKRLNQEAVGLRWEEKQQVPGVEGFTVKKLSITKA
jgi:hypothetical protein